MNENETNVQEAADSGMFLAGLNEEFGEGTTVETGIPDEAQQDGNQTDTAAQEEPGTQGEGGDQKQEEPAGELFELKHLGQTQKVSREQMTEYAQKGMDYDRIRQRAEQLTQENTALNDFKQQNEATVTMLVAMAKDMNMEVPDFLAALEENMLVMGGKDRNVAKEIVQIRARDRADSFARANQAKAAQEAANRRAREDVQRFQAMYPGMDWREVYADPAIQQRMAQGSTLVDAYGLHRIDQLTAENQRLQQENQVAAQDNANRSRAIGSVRTSGANKNKSDPFLEGFDM